MNLPPVRVFMSDLAMSHDVDYRDSMIVAKPFLDHRKSEIKRLCNLARKINKKKGNRQKCN